MTATGDKDWGLADGAAIHGKWDRAGSAGMARCRLPAVRIHGIRKYNRLLNLRAGDCPNGVLYDECCKLTRKPIRSPLGTLGTDPISDAITRAVLKDMFIYNP